MNTRSTAKRAQISVDEANGDAAMAFVFPLNMLRARQEFCDMCNQKFGWNCSVHFAGAWLGEIERYEDTVVENGDLDIDGYDAIEKEEGENDEEVSGAEESGAGAEPDNEPEEADGSGGSSEDRED